MTYPKFGATFFDLGWQLPCQILTKSIKFQISIFFLGKLLIYIKEEFPKENFLILKFFGLRQNLTRQLPAQIKKRSSKFWICYTFKNYLNCGTNFIFEKLRAINVFIFFLFHVWPILTRFFFRNSKKKFRQNLYW